MKISAATTVRLHLYRDGFQSDYWIWTKHGEVKPMVETRGGSTSSRILHHEDQFNAIDEMVVNAFRPYREVLDVNTNMGNETFAEDQLPNEDAKRFYDKLISTNKPIYEEATQSMLSICVQLLAIRSDWHVPQTGIDFVTKMLKSVCPVLTCLPDNYYQATQLVSKLGLKVEKIDCCKKGCMIYYKDDNKLSECKICHSPRFIPRRTGMGKYKDVPAKRMFYFPIIPRLQKLFASIESAAEMRWHHENKKSSNVLHHPSDGKAWKYFDDVYPDFASDPRNVRLGLCSDGFIPYIQVSASLYSCWPIILTPYNLPPERFIPRRIGTGKYKDVPAKRMFYFPIIPRLQRLYASTESAAEMRWHHENKKSSNVLHHPSDGKAWKYFDDVYPDFASDPRNVRLGLCSDGFIPYIQVSASLYSCWPIILTPYNLPPERCITKPYLFLTCLIPGPSNPKQNIDVYLQPLIDYLQQGTQGKLACPHCMEDTKAFTLKYGSKNSCFDCHRRFLPANHSFRRSKRNFTKNRDEKDGQPYIYTGQEVSEVVNNFPKVTEIGWKKKLNGYGVGHNWKKRSIFWDLPYWKDNLLRHNLDVMHIEKNVFDNIFNTVMNIKGKTKDNEKERKDLSLLCFRGDLEMQALPNGKMGKPKANYTLTSSDAKMVCKWLKELRMSYGYASNLARYADVEKGTIHGMKSHDCHVFMECLLLIAFHSLPEFVWKPLTELSRFFKDLCCNTLRLGDLVKLNDNISIIICKLERIFPPGFFDSMEHLLIHLSNEAMLGGPVHYRWMYPFESIFLENHSINEEDASRHIHAEFPIWLKTYVNNEANEVTNKDIIALSRDPSSMAISWNIYFVNGYTFHTKAYNINKKTINSGVHVRGLTEGAEYDYYGTINYIIELDYFGLKNKPPAKIVAPADTITPPSHPTPSPIHASTPEVFLSMPTPCLSIHTMGASSQHSPHETLVEKNVEQTSDDHEDRVEIGDHN
ncbi:uncharacterized protein [Cicer arietinum]|uniref:uncharacterized protein n=1 Tax=Cicer arietinum TaxID=3827 RepID=UPI003CC69AFE